MKNINRCVLCGGENFKLLNGRGILEKSGPIIEFSNVICKKCGLVFINPQPNAGDYRGIYEKYEKSRHSCDNEADVLRQINDCGNKKATEVYGFIKEYLGEEKRVLDLGCGFGQISIGLKNDFNCNVRAIEPSKLLAKTLSEKFGVNVFNGDLDSFFDVNNVKFNIIILHHVLEHFIDPLGALNKLKTMLLPNGVICLEIPDVCSFKKPVDIFFDFMHPYSYSPKTLLDLADITGYKIIKFNNQKKYRLQAIVALKDSAYANIGGEKLWRRGTSTETIRFVRWRRLVDFFAINKDLLCL